MQVSFKRIGGVAILSSLVFAAALFFLVVQKVMQASVLKYRIH